MFHCTYLFDLWSRNLDMEYKKRKLFKKQRWRFLHNVQEWARCNKLCWQDMKTETLQVDFEVPVIVEWLWSSGIWCHAVYSYVLTFKRNRPGSLVGPNLNMGRDLLHLLGIEPWYLCCPVHSLVTIPAGFQLPILLWVYKNEDVIWWLPERVVSR